ncbi:MAG: glycosyltransferase, partial [Lachnospiraceae bacterium]|nr:glycosyltransferase [Lachnospiraceae bacterium]
MGILSVADIRKTLYYFKRNGLKSTLHAAKERLGSTSASEYKPSHAADSELKKQREWSRDKDLLFSIVVPTYRTNEKYLRDMAASVLAQSYPFWELVIADATEDGTVEELVKGYGDKRIKYIHLDTNAGISDNTNRGIEEAKGDYIGLLDHDDLLEPDLLYEAAYSIYKEPGIKLLYTDEDKCDTNAEKYFEPHIKESFNLDLILSNNYICHFLLIEAALMKQLKLRREYDGAQDYDLVLRAVSVLKEKEAQIYHIPKVLYHWRCHMASTAENPQSKLYAYDAGKRALQAFADREEYNAVASPLKHLGFYTLNYKKDIFECRPDIGAVGGRILINNRIAGGRLGKNGELYYEGLSKNYSGYMHRAVLTQDAEAADIRCIRLRPELQKLFKETLNITYTEDEKGMFDVSTLPDCDCTELSLKLSEAVRSAGYRILYSPADNERSIKPTDKDKKCNITDNNGKNSPKEKITVVIPNYNGERYLKDCLESLLDERLVSGTPDFRVLVIDNGSSDKSAEILEKFAKAVDTIYLNENTGFCHAVNEGIKAAVSPYVLLLNKETTVKAGFINALFLALEKRPEAFSVSSKMLMWD